MTNETTTSNRPSSSAQQRIAWDAKTQLDELARYNNRSRVQQLSIIIEAAYRKEVADAEVRRASQN